MIGPTGHRSCLARSQGRAAPQRRGPARHAPRRLAQPGRDRAQARGRPRRLDPPGAGQRGQAALRPAARRRPVSARRPAVPSTRVKPHKVRGRELEEVREADPEGRIVVHHRTIDSLGKMLRSGAIDQPMHDAAKDFQAAFIRRATRPPAGLADPARARHRARPGAQRAPDRRPPRGAPGARGAWAASASPAGSCVWHVVGLQSQHP